MIVVKVELHSAITGQVTELARMGICNIGGTKDIGHYAVETYRGRCARDLAQRIRQRGGEVRGYPRLRLHVWHLVARALTSLGYAKGASEKEQAANLFESAQP